VAVRWIEKVVTLDKGDGELLLRGGARVPCSRQYRADVLARL
jgi:two-component system LytT family response regulator